jgi:hypothetical protein
VLCRVVGGVGDYGVCEGGFSVKRDIQVRGCSVDSYGLVLFKFSLYRLYGSVFR